MDGPLVTDQLPGLRRYARALAGDAWAADDLVQDTLERACDKWKLWTVGTDLRAWLFTLMHNLYLNERRGARVQLASVSMDEAGVESIAAPPRGTDDALDLERCLRLLPDDQRAVLLLVTLEDMDYQSAAQVLGIPIGTVMSRLSRARYRLRELMDGGTSRGGVSGPAGLSPNPPTSEPQPGLRRLK